MLFLFGALLAAGSLAMSARAQSNVVYAVEYKQSTNRVGTIDLLNGNFTRISSIGTAIINDIAYCSTNGTLYGISNSSALVTFNKTNGTITKVANLSVSGIQSLAFRPSNGALFGATQSKLYTINPANGTATSVGNYGSPTNLGSTGQNIRFARDGNLYVSNTSTNTDIYRINTTNGAATWMGEAVGYPYLMLQNASSNMYGVFINLGSSSNASPKLATFDLSSFVNGGTNANGSTHQVTVTLVGAGTNFPANFNFSGNVPQAVTNLTVPVSATGPVNQTVCPGNSAVFSTVASGTPPYGYAWLKNGSTISGQTSSNLTLANVSASDAATYSVIVSGAVGTVTNSAILTVNVPVTVTAAPVNQTSMAGGNATFSVTASGTGLSYQWLFNGSVIGAGSSLALNNLTTSQAGVYTVIVNGTCGSVTNSATLTVTKAGATVTLGSLSQIYNGAAKPATATTTPSGLAVNFTYNGSATVPTSAGSYTVIGTINDANYQGSATGTLVIGQATGSITLSSLSQTYDGSAKPATATTTPTGLTVRFTYNGSATVPTSAGSYTVIGTINDANYQGSATNTLVIAQASGSITLGSLSQTYTGTARPATATTTPVGLAVTFTYNGSATVPTSAGSYTVIGTINDVNYQGSATNTLVINAATLTYTANAASMTYGSAMPGLSGSVSGFVGTDNQGNAMTGTLTFTPAATSSSGVGSYAINGTGLTANNGNYTFVQAAGNATALTINVLPVNLTGTRAYDGTTTAAAGMLSVANKVGSDNVTVVSGSGTLAGANVGSETITSFGTLALGGTAVGNYTLSGASGSVNITVSALALTVTNLLALDKVYDGTTNATLDATNPGLAGVLNGDTVTLVTSNAVAYFADKNVDTNKPVTVAGLALGGAAAANYTLVNPTNVTADITAAELTLAGVTAASKVYDGTTNAQLNGTATLNGEVSGDDVSLVTDGVSAAFAGPNGGTGIPVTVSGYVITGADAGNYTLTQPSDLAADIKAAPLTITATVNTKIYDGSTSATATPTVSGLQGSDTVTGLAETYDTKDVGTGKTLSVSAYTVNDGNSGNNYTVNTATSTAGVISKATLTITAAVNTKTYDGSTSASATPTTSGLQGSDSVTGLAETYDTKNAGTGKTLSVSAYTVNDGNSGNNYTVSTVASIAGVINQATLTITAVANTKIYDDSTRAAATPTTRGLQGSDSVSGLAETYDTKNAGTGKTLSVSTYTVNDGNSGNNYTVSTATSTAGVIDQATLTITAAANTKTYDGSTSATATPTISGLQGSDSVTALAETYDTKDAGTGKTLSVSAYTVNDGNAGGNYAVSTVTSTAGVISQASLTITAVANTKIYDGSTSAAATPTTSGLQGSDSVSGLVETYDTKNAGTGKTLSVSAYTVNDGNSGANYTVSTVANTAGVINKVALTVTADNKSKICGLPNPPLTTGYNGFIGGENASVLSSPVVLSTTATTTSGAGKYPITAGGAAAANYTIQYVNGTLLVASAPQLAGAKVSVNGTEQFVVSWPTIAGQTYQLEYTTGLGSKWTPLGTPFAGTDGIVAVTNSMSVTPQCFFRVGVLEVQ